MDRNRSLQLLDLEEFDLCIIGGGASGAGCALDAALRGLKVVLIEKTDFAAGTSSKSTKLIHGGVRYLEQAFKNFDFGQLRQVRHGLEERHTLLSNAPHLARPLALVTPVFSWLEGLYYRIGLWLYDQFATGADQLPSSRWLRKTEARTLLPGLTDRLHSAVLYYDGQLDDARYCLALVQSAALEGATILNHLEITGFDKDEQGRIQTAQARDGLSGKACVIRARVFLNCTGPQADIVRQMANPALEPVISPSKGVHAMLPLAVLGNPDTALLIPKTADGRVVFAVPFQDKLLVGTTDEHYPHPEQEPSLLATEVRFLQDTLKPYLQEPADTQQVTAGFGGLRPLLAPKRSARQKATKKLVRDHEVEQDPTSGLFSLLGGKWTTYRLMACDAIDAVCKSLGVRAECSTRDHSLAGANDFSPVVSTVLQQDYHLPADIAQHLAANYGSAATQVAALLQHDPKLGARLAPAYPFIRAEVVYAVQQEMACTLRDFLARRIRLEILDWEVALQAIPVVADLMGAELNWSAAEKERQVRQYHQLITEFIARARTRQAE
ncbi:MAG: FAD-dependent oxidoreductase [Bacteroidetes bacterium]|nr:MAG: FAD-dependent oxidoreductase [Bacteroidota bacterium]